jgi:hypothetical protein
MNMRVAPKAVCRSLLTRLDSYQPLSASEETAVLSALKSTQIPDVTDRMLAGLSRSTLQEILKSL